MSRIQRVAIALALTMFAMTGCGPARTLDASLTAPVRIGLVVPLMGEFGSDGRNWRDAVVLAVREVNAAGGVLPGRRVELLIEDSESTTAGGVEAAQRLIDQGVVGIIGDVASSSTLAILDGPIANANPPVLLASGLSTSPILTERNEAAETPDGPGWWFFRTVPPDDRQYLALANVMYDYDTGCRRVAVLFADNDYGRPFRDGIARQFANVRGGVLVPTADGVPYTEALGDYTTQVQAVAAATPDCIALIAYPQSAGVIINDWNLLAMPPAVRWFGTDGVRQPGFVDEVGDPQLIDGFLGTAPLTEQMTPAYNRFAERYQVQFGTAPVSFSSNLYDATALMLLAIARAGGTDDREAIRDAVMTLNETTGTVVQAGELAAGLRYLRSTPVRSINYEGASGPVDVDALGNVEGAFELWRYDAPPVGTTGPGVFTSVETVE